MDWILDKQQQSKKAGKELDQRKERERQITKKFFSSEDGKELLAMWSQTHLIDIPSDYMGQDLYSLGRAEGRKDFVRNLVHFMKSASEGKA